MFLTGKQIIDNGCISGDAPHVNGAGVDLSIGALGKLDYKICKLQHITDDDIIWQNPNKAGNWTLHAGRSYIAVTREEVHAQTMDHPPKPLLGIIQLRSSLASCGVSMATAFVDPGFHGPLRLPLVCNNGSGFYLEPGARICQVAFTIVDDGAEMYHGHYQNREFGKP